MVSPSRISTLLLVASTTVLLLVKIPGSLAQGGGGGGGGSGGGAGGSTSSESLGEECDTTGLDADYSERLIGSGELTERNIASETNCPNHINWPINPNAARVIGSNVTIPAYPVMFAEDGTTDLSNAALSTGIMLNGVALYSSWGRETVETYEDTAFFIESDTFDPCGGHATTEGGYHYHNTPGCLQEQAMAEAGTTEEEHSPQLGWAFDGFPVYGQLGVDGVEMLMCGVDGADDTYCLDLCSGHAGELPGVDGFMYRYYLSCGADEAYFPFTTNCYRGCCPDGMSCDSQVEACGDTTVVGYTDDYVPEVAVDLSAQYDADFIDGDDSEVVGSRTTIDCSLYLGSVEAGDSSAAVSVAPLSLPVLEAATIVGSLAIIGQLF